MFAFAPNNHAQSTMDLQLDASLGLDNQPFSHTTIPFTPELSNISTPDSIQSATFQQLQYIPQLWKVVRAGDIKNFMPRSGCEGGR